MAYEDERNLIEILDDLEDFIDETGTPVRFSNGKIGLDREILMSMLAELRARVPMDISRGQQIIETEQSILDAAREQAENIKADATIQAQSIVEEAMREASEAVDQEEITKIAKKHSAEMNAQAEDYVKQAEEYAEKVVEKAQADAKEIRLGALDYTLETVEALESFVTDFKKAQQGVFAQLIEGLQIDLEDMDQNRRQVENQISALKRK